MQLGAEIVARFHGAQAGPAAQAAFIAQFSRGALPDDIPTIKIGVPSSEGLPIARALKEAGLVSSNAEGNRSEEHTSELQSLMRISYAVFCLKKKKNIKQNKNNV